MKTDGRKPIGFPKFDFSAVARHRWAFLLLSLLVAAVFVSFNPLVETIDNVDYFMVEDNPDAEFYERFKDVFGEDEFFIVAFESEDLFSAESLAMLGDVTEALESMEEVRDATSLANVLDIYGAEDYFEVGPFMEKVPETREESAALKSAALGNPLYIDGLVSRDGDTAAVLVETYEDAGDSGYKKRLLEKTRGILSEYEKKGIDFYLAGSTVTNFTLSQYMNRDMAVFVPATYALIAATIWFFFRNARLTAAALANISVCVLATRGFMGMAGLTLNNITSIVVPLVMALSLCDTVHIFSRLDRKILDETRDGAAAIGRVLSGVALPCFMTTFTTAVGFISLAVSGIPAIREFAYAAAAGMIFEFFFSFFLLPPLLLLFEPSKIFRESENGAGLSRVLQWTAEFVHRRKFFVLALSIAVVAASLWYASRIKVETNMIEFFKPDSPVRKATDFVETRLGGVSTFDISLKAENEDAFKNPEMLEVVQRIQEYLESRDDVDRSLSFVDFLKDMNESFHNEDEAYYRIPDSREMVAQYLLLYDSEEIEDFVNGAFDHARISVRISEHGSLRQKEIIRSVREYLDKTDKRGLDVRITGRVVNEINVVDDLVKGQISSLSLAALVIGVTMLFVFRSAGLALLSMPPNLFPIVVNFGIMGFAGIPLDTGTALIAAVALGIAVDDTIHLLHEYRTGRLLGMPVSISMKSATIIKGRAILSSSIILTIGFGVLMASSFVPIVHFGLLTALIMLTAVVGDLIVLPAMVYAGKGDSP